MRIFKYIVFISILSGIFFVIYRQSDKKGFRRWWTSFKTAIIFSAIAAGLIPVNSEAIEPPGNNNQVYQERLLSDQEFNSFEDNDQQVIFVKGERNPITLPINRGPNSFPTAPSGGRPNRPVYLPKYRTAPKIVNPGLGAGANPAGAGGGGGAAEFNDQCSVPNKEQSQELSTHHHDFTQKSKKQKALEKMKRELQESIEEEDKLNAQRKKDGKATITLIIKDGLRFFAPNDKLRDKFHHATDLDSPIPETLGEAELARLSKSGLYRERLETFRNREILPEAYVEQTGRDLRLHALNPDTRIIKGTFGGNREARDGTPKIQGYHLYNDKTGFNAFFDMNGRQYRTGMKASNAQQKDLKQNNNFL
jgi:hypothetical protein